MMNAAPRPAIPTAAPSAYRIMLEMAKCLSR
jgi:hypothetical protein